MGFPRRVVALAAVATLLATVDTPEAHAAPPELATCANAYEQGQRLRRQGALRAARDQIVVCARDTCPAILRDDCSKWLREVETAMPTVVLVANVGSDAVADVRVVVDGAPFVESLDGKAVEIDPGEHLFRFEPRGKPAVEKRVVILEAQKAQTVAVALGESKPPPAASTTPTTAPPPPPPPPQRPETRPVPWTTWLFGAVGVAGLGVFAGFGLAGKNKLGTLDSDGCKPNCDSGPVSSAKSNFLVADVSLGVSIVALGAATYFFLTRPAVESNEGGR